MTRNHVYYTFNYTLAAKGWEWRKGQNKYRRLSGWMLQDRDPKLIKVESKKAKLEAKSQFVENGIKDIASRSSASKVTK